MSQEVIGKKFEIGDICLLKSGSPELTITDIFPDGKRLVSWFDDNGRVEFPPFH